MTAWQPAAAAALDALALAVLVVDRQGHILHANREATDLLDRPDGALSGQPAGGHGSLGTKPQGFKHLGARQAEGRSRLHALIQAACDGRSGDAGGFLQLESGSPDEPGVSVCVSPLADVEAETPGRAVVVARLLRAQGRIEVQLRTLFGLTRAEAQVGAALARGGCLAEIAAELGISVTTARTHVARIFLKTGTKQQSQLVALVAAVQLPVACAEAAQAPLHALRSSR
ncbi:DNA-binding transcriptional regulator, CsgD family [Methylobacterium sp. 174MFSha1.1]|uniref:helix-turn-helix transcriptional regulator n=1 Tax=Methylobacterium sp. 174MFSha1.1 TaxID=1502749 RepID=UPI0008ED6A04|nr:helix-turn-helix transcriptional regulator [Methylobacterium sp. 174MFSha1.1]SFU81939.1 DNA-binding transcriptional regulator, CsgD family [Methylobacterium sp. 174MFSha1.1]